MGPRRWAWMGLCLAVGLGGCGSSDDGGGAAAPGACTPPATPTVYFKQDVYPILSARCTPCHADAQSALPKFASVDPDTSYSAAKGFVDPQHAASSLLVLNPTGHNGHPEQITDAQAATITQWIKECAPNNSRDTTAKTTP